MRTPSILRGLALPLLLVLAAAAAPARAEWLQPDPTYREAQLALRVALRDTVGRGNDAAALDSLGVALMRLARTGEAEVLFRRVLALAPGDDTAEAGLGKLALFSDRLAEAESLLVAAGSGSEEVARDLYAVRLRRGEWNAAAELCEQVNEAGRAPLLQRLAEIEPFRIVGSHAEANLMWARAYPVPLVRARLNGHLVLMAVDLGASDLILDPMWASRAKLTKVPGQSLIFWSGSRFAARNAVVPRFELGGIRIENVPAGLVSLRKWSIEVNPHGETVAGVIGLNLLRRFTPTLDYKRQRLELRPLAAGPRVEPGASKVPFELWGESELMVRGTVGASRKLAMVVQTGIPGCGFAAPSEVFDELGIKAGSVSRMIKGAGAWLQGRPWVAVKVPSITLGPVVKDRVDGWSNALDSGELWRHGVRRDAVLAGDFFEDQRVTIDWAKRELLFELQ